MKKKILFVALGIAAVTMASCGPHRHPHCRSEKMGERIENHIANRIDRKLDLTDKQEEKLRAIISEVSDEMKPERKEMKNTFDLLEKQFKSDTVDRAALEKNLDEREKRMQEKRAFMLDKFTEFHAMLTPEQREKVIEEMEELKEKCDEK